MRRTAVPACDRAGPTLTGRLSDWGRHLTIHTRALSEISSASSDRFGSGAALQALVRKMTTLRFLAIQGTVPAAITNSLSDPLTGQKLCIGTLESVSLVCAW